ncbi:hypothetical protein QR680_007286 [Steinernema hermaphroditum]|uniref:Uncharacterized protein n=1 Tax=Steinernema hermaphroditum TaxID=289476 RepID=A0AA39HZK0_9BILA|nr:hypothetical protein QR680_007286 [Steinernema hermaphroditum]
MLRILLALVLIVAVITAEEGAVEGAVDGAMNEAQAANTDAKGEVVTGTKQAEGDALVAGIKGYYGVVQPALSNLKGEANPLSQALGGSK